MGTFNIAFDTIIVGALAFPLGAPRHPPLFPAERKPYLKHSGLGKQTEPARRGRLFYSSYKALSEGQIKSVTPSQK
jgi:hypothetical protein